MMKINRSTILSVSVAIVAMFSAGVSLADVVSNTESWNNAGAGLNGWVGVGDVVTYMSSGGYNNTGYFKSSRVYSAARPSEQATSAASSGLFSGNIETRYGEGQIKISFYNINMTTNSGGHTPVTPAPKMTVSIFESLTNWHMWYINLDSIASSWTLQEVTFDTNWTDEEALAAGWAKTAGTDTFANTMNMVDAIRLQPVSRMTDWSGESGVVGLDEFTMQSVPEPVTLGLLGAGGMLLSFIRRRK